MPLAARSESTHRLATLIRDLGALTAPISGESILNVLARSELDIEDVATYVGASSETYSRRCVARTDEFEVLVMTWLPGQGAGAHDHAGSVSVFKILQGAASETRFTQACDSLADAIETCELPVGDAGVDPGDLIHAVRNDLSQTEPLVSIHVYAPPLPELRRFTARTEGQVLPDPFKRRPASSTPVIAIVGAGFSGSMVAAQLADRTSRSTVPMHIAIIDRQPSIAEGAAYRTPDARHLLNAPASDMSAWPDRPDDFLEWMRNRHPEIEPYAFLQRRTYGEYLRATFFDAFQDSGSQTSVDIRRDEATYIERRTEGGWRVTCHGGLPIDADVVVVTTGHRPPTDPMNHRWMGSRSRYIEDPWASLALTSIDPHESVCLLGSGLTAIDVLQRLMSAARTAPILALSRRGLLPAIHAPAALAPLDASNWLEPSLHAPIRLTATAISRALRAAIRTAVAAGHDWRQVIDGLRAHSSQIWTALAASERNRFLRHARPFWEVSRHRMAPAVAATVASATQSRLFSTVAGRVVSGHGSLNGVDLTLQRRGGAGPDALHFDWVVNCTGPGSGRGVGFSPVVAGLIEAGHLQEDSAGLGVHSAPTGQALVDGRIIDDLVVVGSLRKGDAWESTAVPELRVQAAAAAGAIVERLGRR